MKKILNILRVIISLGLLALLFWIMRDRLTTVLAALKSVNLFLFFLAGVLFFICIVVISYRLKLIFKGQDINLTLKECLYLNMVGYFFNNFLPTAVGGDVVKIYYAAIKTKRKLESFTSVVVDRIFAMFPFNFIAMVALLFVGTKIENRFITIAVFFLFFATLLGILFLLNRNFAKRFAFLLNLVRFGGIDAKLKKIYNALNCYKDKKRILLVSFIGSIVAQAVSIIALWIIGLSISVRDVPLGVFFLVVPLVAVITMLPSLGGLGIREGAYVYFLKTYTSPENALALSILWFGLLLVMSFIGGLLYLFRHNIYKIDIKEVISND